MTPSYEVLTATSNTPEWLRLRQGGVGASDAAAILGDSAWGTALTVFAQKRNPNVVDIQTDLMEFGHLAEPLIVRFLENHPERYGWMGEIIPSEGLLRSKEHPHLLGTLDRNVRTPSGIVVPLELKSIGGHPAKEWRITDDEDGMDFGGYGGLYAVPKKYQVQVQQQMAITGAPFAYVAAWLDKDTMVTLKVERDDEFIEQMLVGVLGEFWYNHVVTGIPPKPVMGDDLMALFPGIKGTQITATPDIYDVVGLWRGAAQEMRDLKKIIDQYKFAMHDFMGDATELVDPLDPKKIIHTLNPQGTARRAELDRLEAEFKDAYDACVRPGKGTRVHRATKGELRPLEERMLA